jgi:hypothetical protein
MVNVPPRGGNGSKEVEVDHLKAKVNHLNEESGLLRGNELSRGSGPFRSKRCLRGNGPPRGGRTH